MFGDWILKPEIEQKAAFWPVDSFMFVISFSFWLRVKLAKSVEGIEFIFLPKKSKNDDI